ncbi:nascent polypeptide-associated complex subunit alpha-like protein [Musa troglodytarum]|uniref:Nascent polypeptide-associated complex subunit alpha-like protein n=1 Tax=Musa troglodytarum TaxID=320322 RepID=A0A9E7ETL4_9LILI|nr:nascent polypeptide-associated complex subunit alpha-like protein [Musa troglodytarum]
MPSSLRTSRMMTETTKTAMMMMKLATPKIGNDPVMVFRSDHEAGADDSSKQSRSEKKSRKAMMKLGMKPVTGASRITLKRTKTPHVFKSPNSDTYENLWRGKNRGFELQAAQQFRILDLSNMVAKVDLPSGGLEPRDIDLVVTQAGVSRAKAVKALKTNNGDIVSAIMELTA